MIPLDTEAIMSNSGWCDDPESKNYNQHVKLPIDARVLKNYLEVMIYMI